MVVLEHATLCLLNAERTSHGLHRMGTDGRFRRVALDHSRDMVARHYFAHRGPGGRDFLASMAKFYAPQTRWLVGENLGWGEGHQGSPRVIVGRWMASPDHRDNILTAAFTRIGIGLVSRVPHDRGLPGATYTTEFGTT